MFSRHARLWLASSGGGWEESDGGDIHRRPLVAGLGVQIGRRGAGPPKLDDHLGRCPRLRRAACGRKKEGLDRRRGLNARTQYASFGSA